MNENENENEENDKRQEAGEDDGIQERDERDERQ